nr:MAG TPA: protein of unknown function DUF859 [Caudoviricetes sp.]
MASIYGGKSNGWQLRLDYSSAQNQAKNQSTITLDLWIYDGTGYSQNESSNEAYYILQGTKVWHPYYYSSTGWYKLGSRTITVDHNSDGSKTVTLSASWDCGFSSSYTPRTLSVSGSVTLPTIPRAATLSYGAMTMGTAATIKITPPVSGATSTITYKFGSASGTIVTKTSAASVRWTPPTSLAAQIPNSASGTGTLTVETYSGSTKLGSRAYTVTISVPSTMTPTLTVAISDPTGRADTYGGYIQSKSRLKVELTAAGVQGSTIKSYAIKVGDILSATSDTATSGYIPASGSLTVTASATDSRGRTKTVTQTVTVTPYVSPTISALEVVRCKANGTEDPTGAYAKATFSGAITALGSKNTAAYRVETRETGTETWSTVATAAAGQYSPTDVSVVFAAAANKKYDVRMVAVDAFESLASSTRFLPAAYTSMHIADSMRSVGIGRLCDKEDTFQVGLEASFDEPVELGKGLAQPLPVDSGGTGVATLAELLAALGVKDYIVEQGTSGNWTYHKYASGYADLWWRGTVTPTSYTAVGSMVYTNVIRLSMPFGVTGNVAVTGTGDNLHILTNVDWSYANKTVSFRLLRAASMTLGEQVVALRVVGKWKT